MCATATRGVSVTLLLHYQTETCSVHPPHLFLFPTVFLCVFAMLRFADIAKLTCCMILPWVSFHFYALQGWCDQFDAVAILNTSVCAKLFFCFQLQALIFKVKAFAFSLAGHAAL